MEIKQWHLLLVIVILGAIALLPQWLTLLIGITIGAFIKITFNSWRNKNV